MLFYVAGPMRGYPHYNAEAFAAACMALRSLGHETINPHDLDREAGYDLQALPATTDWSRAPEGFSMFNCRARDFAAIAQADGIVMLDGWQQSSGACGEYLEAVRLGKEIRGYGEAGAGNSLHFIVLNQGQRNRVQSKAAEWCAASVESTTPVGEVRVTDPVTGGQKGSKPARFDLIPTRALWLLACLYGRGCQKYADRNWERGYKWSLSYAAMQRHATKYWAGENADPETGVPHLIAVAWHAFALVTFAVTHPELDDRSKDTGSLPDTGAGPEPGIAGNSEGGTS